MSSSSKFLVVRALDRRDHRVAAVASNAIRRLLHYAIAMAIVVVALDIPSVLAPSRYGHYGLTAQIDAPSPEPRTFFTRQSFEHDKEIIYKTAETQISQIGNSHVCSHSCIAWLCHAQDSDYQVPRGLDFHVPGFQIWIASYKRGLPSEKLRFLRRGSYYTYIGTPHHGPSPFAPLARPWELHGQGKVGHMAAPGARSHNVCCAQDSPTLSTVSNTQPLFFTMAATRNTIKSADKAVPKSRASRSAKATSQVDDLAALQGKEAAAKRKKAEEAKAKKAAEAKKKAEEVEMQRRRQQEAARVRKEEEERQRKAREAKEAEEAAAIAQALARAEEEKQAAEEAAKAAATTVSSTTPGETPANANVSPEEASAGINDVLGALNAGRGMAEDPPIDSSPELMNLDSPCASPVKKRSKAKATDDGVKRRSRSRSKKPSKPTDKATKEPPTGKRDRNSDSTLRRGQRIAKDPAEQVCEYAHERVILDVSMQLPKGPEAYGAYLANLGQLFDNLHYVDEMVIIHPLSEHSSATPLSSKNDLPTNLTKALTFFSVGGGPNAFKPKKDRNGKKGQKKEKAPYVWSNVIISSDVDPRLICDTICYEWGRLTQGVVRVKDLQCLDTVTAWHLFYVYIWNDYASIKEKFVEILGDIHRKMASTQLLTAEEKVQPVPEIAISAKVPRLINHDVSQYNKLDDREQSARRALTIEVDESKVGLLKKLVEQMCLYERAAFTVHEGVVDKYGNKPFWARDDAPVVIELDLRVIGCDEKLSPDGGVVKRAEM